MHKAEDSRWNAGDLVSLHWSEADRTHTCKLLKATWLLRYKLCFYYIVHLLHPQYWLQTKQSKERMMRWEEIKERTEMKSRFCCMFKEVLSFLRRVRRVASTVAMTLTAVEECPVFWAHHHFSHRNKIMLQMAFGKKKKKKDYTSLSAGTKNN